jgi:hypothetical protein
MRRMIIYCHSRLNGNTGSAIQNWMTFIIVIISHIKKKLYTPQTVYFLTELHSVTKCAVDGAGNLSTAYPQILH